jgi:hypothetical protein
MPINAGSDRRNARPHASAATAGFAAHFSRAHTDGDVVGRRRFGFALTVSRDDAGGDCGDSFGSGRFPPTDRSMFWKYAWCDQAGNFLETFSRRRP